MFKIQNLWGGLKRQKRHNSQQTHTKKKHTQNSFTKLSEVDGPQQSIFAPLKSKDANNTLTQPKVIQACWCEHYTEVLNHHPIVDESVLDLNCLSL